MTRITLAIVVTLLSGLTPALAQKGSFDVLASAQWINRVDVGTARSADGSRELASDFETGGGIGFGFNYFFSDRWSFEVKGSAFQSNLTVRGFGSDFGWAVDVGTVEIFPINGIIQYRFRKMGAWQPYLGGGVSYVIVRDIDSERLRAFGIERLEFDETAGIVINAGSDFWFADRWAIVGDARYVPLETEGEARFVGNEEVGTVEINPLIISAGLRYRFP